MLGTIVNALAVIAGCLVGLVVKGRLTEKMGATIMKGLGLCTKNIGISGALNAEETLQMIICIAVGGLIGEILDLDAILNNLGQHIDDKLNSYKKDYTKEQVSIAEVFVTSSLLFCVGAMAVVGSLESGLQGNHTTLFAKSVLDGVSSIIFTSTLGIGVMLSSVTILIYQGGITLLAGCLSTILTDTVITSMSAIGSLLILGLGLNVAGATDIKVANLLPAIFLPVIIDLIMKFF